MTDFQMSLIAAGGIFVVGVISYNKWQEYKARKSVERAFSTDHDDVLMKGGAAPAARFDADIERHEPVLDGVPAEPLVPGPDLLAEPVVHEPHAAPAPAAAPAAAASAPAAARDPALDAAAALPGAKPDTPPAQLAENLVDPLIDCIIPLNVEGALRGDRALPALLKLRRVGNKPVHYVGLAVNGDWEPVVHGGVYTKLQAGVQLATRTTALNELEYSELVTRLRAVGDEIGAEPEVPDMIEVMSEAKTLHRFVAGHDAQLGVNLASKGAPWPMSTLVGALEAAGFDVRPDGKFAMPDAEGHVNHPLFTLSTNVTMGADTTPRLTLLLDVPCVAPAKDGFGRMVACARDLVQRLDAAIVDDFDQPLSDETLDEIAGQVREFYQEMDAADIPAGSTRALRLFG
ncbi:cell division protein ZipA C-terminal FtsZ-binding domain-containing protein [Massilia sp. YIM B02763]|uniref:cell division protein ZipA C-terminal FtsZ-binding domain-containing protein n=1 Tax=Massilia sp. YIM B02763 TaxID=3050130 RepID=UPI0025B69622|nr:cell division protein ZipA C-terminal FtsZ-binding domain-containing protein [Massilia sp. YIM B02763]MDN4051818.1 cell division protein ZipA C-terminal FtsZ-binding domain-containing protein [Massilia sp. YIM B02763]